MKRFFIKLVLPAFLLFSCLSVSGQFTYVHANLGYSSTGLSNSDALNNRVRNLSLNIGGVQRVLKPIGIGFELNIPLLKPGEKNYDNSYDNTGYFFDGWDEANGNFAPDEFSYVVGFKTISRLLMRVYLGDNTDEFYFELRYAFGSMKEEYNFERDGFIDDNTIYPALSLDYSRDRSFKSPGLAVGYQSTSDNHFFFNTRLGFDLVNYDRGGFNYIIPYQNSFNGNVVSNGSLIPEKGTIWFYDIGFGYFF